ncbi:hypothetical protein [Colwellia sp. RSH04]|uniref:hypothetical protein n=1 Tax=Colwellia sp. RSH04 TaxID=2305464 RepID=UPI000E57F0CE|nr:hypothetical protein [Colwellia sp. RSH04]RHW75742.1 hypothetical protein D1094_11500 [Colwellia sp. RSH04]
MQKGIYTELPIDSDTLTLGDLQLDIKALKHQSNIAFDTFTASITTGTEQTLPTIYNFSDVIISDIPKLIIGKEKINSGTPPAISTPTKKQIIVFFTSILAHILLVIALWFAAKDSAISKTKFMQSLPEVKTIKSYLYAKPVVKKPKTITTIQAPEITQAKDLEKAEPTQKPIMAKPTIKKAVAAEAETHIETAVNKIENASTNQTSKEKTPTPTKQRTFSAYGQLSKLRDSINKSIMQKEIDDKNGTRTLSGMTPNPFPVPHSTIQLTPEQIKEKNTSNFGGGTITKVGDGLCTIEREQMLGSPIEASVSAFACGESDFDKSFRAHMQKVNKKINPVN